MKVCNRVNKSKSNFSENTVFQTMKTSIFERIKSNKAALRSVKPGSLFHKKRTCEGKTLQSFKLTGKIRFYATE